MRNKKRQLAAQEAMNYMIVEARRVLFGGTTGERIVTTTDAGSFGLNLVKAAIILGTGWGDVLLNEMRLSWSCPLVEIPGFEYLKELQELGAHKRILTIADINGKTVAMMRGRIHLNESHDKERLFRAARLQIEMLMELGIEHFILTNATGSLRPSIKVGDTVAYDSFVLPPMFEPLLWGGEFESPEDVLKDENILKIQGAAEEAELKCHRGTLGYVRGPSFEGRKKDKQNLRANGADTAGMSIAPECSVLALDPKCKVYAVGFITNTDSEEHSDETNRERAKQSSDKLGQLLLNLISSL
ncbi:hypothetical protein KJ885_05900 [Patescibacteria group bacterium]|nr:hypothetical protein [Patescibacteria group bacterium]